MKKKHVKTLRGVCKTIEKTTIPAIKGMLKSAILAKRAFSDIELALKSVKMERFHG